MVLVAQMEAWILEISAREEGSLPEMEEERREKEGWACLYSVKKVRNGVCVPQLKVREMESLK